MKIYTKTGDKGTTSMYDGVRAPKYYLQFNVLGEMDELTSRIGLLKVLMSKMVISLEKTLDAANCGSDSSLVCLGGKLPQFLNDLQQNIQTCNSYIATSNNINKRFDPLMKKKWKL
jgi:hypothetical protein